MCGHPCRGTRQSKTRAICRCQLAAMCQQRMPPVTLRHRGRRNTRLSPHQVRLAPDEIFDHAKSTPAGLADGMGQSRCGGVVAMRLVRRRHRQHIDPRCIAECRKHATGCIEHRIARRVRICIAPIEMNRYDRPSRQSTKCQGSLTATDRSDGPEIARRRMRTGAVGQIGHPRQPAFPRRLRDQRPRTQGLVVGMGGDHQPSQASPTSRRNGGQRQAAYHSASPSPHTSRSSHASAA